MPIILPVEKSKLNRNFKSQKFAMLGTSGIGKSTFWAQDENALFLETEAGLNHLEVYKVPIRSWNDLREAYGLLYKSFQDNKLQYSVIVIDTIDRLIDYAQEEVIERAKEFYKKIEINTVGDIPNGMGWFKTKEIVNTFLTKLELLPSAVAYVSHLSIKRITDGSLSFDKSTISVGGQLGEDLLAWSDHTLHIETHLMGDKLIRKVWTKPTQSREAKSRGSVIPDGWKWTDDMKENYKYFRGLFI